MLVLSRHKDESIVITTDSGDRIVVTVTEIRSDKVRIGIIADDSVTINRQEIQEAIENANPTQVRDE